LLLITSVLASVPPPLVGTLREAAKGTGLNIGTAMLNPDFHKRKDTKYQLYLQTGSD